MRLIILEQFRDFSHNYILAEADANKGGDLSEIICFSILDKGRMPFLMNSALNDKTFEPAEKSCKNMYFIVVFVHIYAVFRLTLYISKR